MTEPREDPSAERLDTDISLTPGDGAAARPRAWIEPEIRDHPPLTQLTLVSIIGTPIGGGGGGFPP